MIEINLLSKELKRKGKGFAFDKRLFYMGAIAVILVALFVVISIFQSFRLKALDKNIADAKRRTEELKKTIELVDALIDLKGKLLQRMSAIETLDKSRASWVYILEDLSQRVPENLWLSVLREEDASTESPKGTEADTTAPKVWLATLPRKMNMEGYAYSINSLALFLIELMRSDYFKNMELQFVKKTETEKQKIFSFGLSGELVYIPELKIESSDTMEIAKK